MDFDDLDSPFVTIEEEQLIDVCDILPPSFFSDIANITDNSHLHFIDPPSIHHPLSNSPPHVASPPDYTEPTLPTSIISRSPSIETTSTQAESALTDEDMCTSPIATTRAPDRERSTKSTFDIMRETSATRGGFRRIPGALPSDRPSPLTANPSTAFSPGTLRRINALSSYDFQIAIRNMGASNRAASANGDISFTRQRNPIHRPEGDEVRAHTD